LTERVSGLDQPWKRLPIVVSTAVFVWFGLLTLCGLFLSHMVAEPPDQTAIEARLLEMPGRGSPTSAGASASIPRSGPTTNAATLLSSPKAGSHKSTARPKALKPTSNHRVAQPDNRVALLPVSHSIDADSHLDEPSAPAIEPGDAPARSDHEQTKPQGLDATANPGSFITSNSRHTIGRPSIVNNMATGAGDADGSGGGGSGAHPIYSPVPSIPDDMRDEVLQATAVARFHVARDGSATVALIGRTDFAELDQLILDALSHWRFRPAVRDGVAVESDAEVRLRITVQ
jgi:protein TonB